MLQLTSRDEAMLDLMNVVRLADVDAIRWALSAYQDDHDGAGTQGETPRSLRGDLQ